MLLTHFRHRPRKINSVLTPHGFKWLSGKIEQDAAAKDTDSHEDDNRAVLKTPAKSTKKVAKTPKSKEPKTPKSNKKRKFEEEEEEPEDDDADVNKGEEDDAVDSAKRGEEDQAVVEVDAALKEEGSEED